MAEGQLSLLGNVTGADVQLAIERQGYALLEHGISADAIDAMVAAYADFTDNHPNPDATTMDRMIINPRQLDELDYEADALANSR